MGQVVHEFRVLRERSPHFLAFLAPRSTAVPFNLLSEPGPCDEVAIFGTYLMGVRDGVTWCKCCGLVLGNETFVEPRVFRHLNQLIVLENAKGSWTCYIVVISVALSRMICSVCC